MSSPPPRGPDWDGSPEPWFGHPHGPAGWAAPLSDPLVPADMRGWLDRVVGVVRRSLIPLLVIQLAVGVASKLLEYLLLPDVRTLTTALLQPAATGTPTAPLPPLGPGFLAGMILIFCVGIVGQCACVYVALRDAAGRPVTAEATGRFAVQRAPLLVGWQIVAIMIAVAGFLLLFAPGVYVVVVFSAALTGVVVVERGTLARCFELVNPRLLPTFGRMVVAGVAMAVYSLVSGFVERALSTPGSLNAALLDVVLSAPVGVVGTGVVLVTYAELRFHENHSVLTATLAEQADAPPARPEF
jgi:hypothetical protein